MLNLYHNVIHVWVYDTNAVYSTYTCTASTKECSDKIRRKKRKKVLNSKYNLSLELQCCDYFNRFHSTLCNTLDLVLI